MRRQDTIEEHRAKVERKERELRARGWSDARIRQYLKDWGMFDCSTVTSRKSG